MKQTVKERKTWNTDGGWKCLNCGNIIMNHEEQTYCPKQRRGFAAMAPEKRSAIASMGGKAAHAAGTAHKYNSEEARAAGSKGGKARRTKP